MALVFNENTSFLRFDQENSSFEHRPMMLKDFLRDDRLHSYSSPSSSSSNGFQMYPRKKPCKSTVAASSKSNIKPPIVLLRSWSKKAAATRISAIHKVINVVKFLQFASSKSPLVLTRSISRKLPKRGKDKNGILGDVSGVNKVKVKDILRWRSFRDVAEDNSSPLDFPSSPSRSTTTTTTTSCSKISSWCDSDFTAEESQLWGGENGEIWGKKCFTGQSAGRNSKGDWSFEEYEQQSPVSVLDTPFREVEESISPFHPALANVERAKCILTQRIDQELEGTTKPKYTRKNNFGGEIAIFRGAKAAEEKAKELLSHIKVDSISQDDDHVIFDFFKHEFSLDGNLHSEKFDYEILKVAKSWVDGECDESYDWEAEDKRESYVKDMEKRVCWKKFTQEQQVVSKELEIKVWDELLDELLMDFLTN